MLNERLLFRGGKKKAKQSAKNFKPKNKLRMLL